MRRAGSRQPPQAGPRAPHRPATTPASSTQRAPTSARRGPRARMHAHMTSSAPCTDSCLWTASGRSCGRHRARPRTSMWRTGRRPRAHTRGRLPRRRHASLSAPARGLVERLLVVPGPAAPAPHLGIHRQDLADHFGVLGGVELDRAVAAGAATAGRRRPGMRGRPARRPANAQHHARLRLRHLQRVALVILKTLRA